MKDALTYLNPINDLISFFFNWEHLAIIESHDVRIAAIETFPAKS